MGLVLDSNKWLNDWSSDWLVCSDETANDTKNGSADAPLPSYHIFIVALLLKLIFHLWSSRSAETAIDLIINFVLKIEKYL